MLHLARIRRFVASLVFCLWAALPAAAQGQGQVPHRGSFVGTGTPAIVQGHSTLLGNFHGIGTITNQTPTGIEGTYVWTGAHGDAISGTFAITLTTMIAPGVFLFVETATVTGGTGRFVNASGQGTALGVINLITSDFWADFNGLMSSIGSLQ